MVSRRTQKASQAIREVVSMAILADIKDPRVRDVTVTHVEVTPDMRSAKVYVSIMGDETKQNLGLHGLKSSAGFLQSKVAKRIDTRYTPRLEFVLDLGVKKSIEIAQILHNVLPRPAADAAPSDDAAAELDGGEDDEANGKEIDDEEVEAEAGETDDMEGSDAPPDEDGANRGG